MKKILLLPAVAMSLFSCAQSIPNYVPIDSLQGWYPFNGNADNALGNGKNGVPLGGCSLTIDRFGNENSAYHFNGDSSHILIDTPFFNVGWPNFTISNWLELDTLNDPYVNGQSQMVFNTIPHNGLAFNMNWNSNNHYAFFVNSDPGLTYSWNIVSEDMSHAFLAGTQHHWVNMVFVKSSGTNYSVYLNGTLDHSFSSSITAVNYFCRIMFGRIDTIYQTEAFWGKLDDYGIWNRALDPCEIRRLYTASPYSYITIQPSNVSAADMSSTSFTVSDTGATNYQWQVNTGAGGFVDLSNTAPYSGVTTPTLTIASVRAGMNSYQYRCMVSGTTVCLDTSTAGVLSVVTTGINGVPIGKKISLAPNPTDGIVAVLGIDKVNIKVYNAIGELVQEAKNVSQISLAELPAAVYMIKLYDNQGTLLYNSKVVKE